MNVDMDLYKVFCEVVKYKSFSKTAESIYVSQSAITQSIQKLENLLGGKLFVRLKSGVELTDEGRNLYEYVKDSVECISNAENIFSQYTSLEKGTIRIGSGSSLFASLLLKPFLEFTKKYPNISFTVYDDSFEEKITDLINGKLDIVTWNLASLDNQFTSSVEFTTLGTPSYCFVASKEYVKEHNIKKLKDIEGLPLILPKTRTSKYQILMDYCSKYNLKLHSNYDIPDSDVAKPLILNNLGVAFIIESALEDIKDKVEIIERIENPALQSGIATLGKNMQNKATVEFIKEIKKYN